MTAATVCLPNKLVYFR